MLSTFRFAQKPLKNLRDCSTEKDSSMKLRSSNGKEEETKSPLEQSPSESPLSKSISGLNLLGHFNDDESYYHRKTAVSEIRKERIPVKNMVFIVILNAMFLLCGSFTGTSHMQQQLESTLKKSAPCEVPIGKRVVERNHKVPIPAKSTELETNIYKGSSSEHWNTTCGSHRQWDDKLVKWVQIPKEKRKCSDLYNKYPFVFVMADGSEVLRQGDEVIHRSFIE
ncbi:predicted protein [Chaetoceros tenuissimus]|uniref:Uncharacterized protein n=1 Tax=Chaetoceros tenuissimus TaxID=426638 RepID=A0AAD3D444_9STRA|nr:predicted protein [Chaetoceros tenuissimus]